MLIAVEKGVLHTFKGKTLDSVNADGTWNDLVISSLFINIYNFSYHLILEAWDSFVGRLKWCMKYVYS